MFEEAKNLEAYAKIAIYGKQGSGKSRTASEIATGISTLLKERKLGSGRVGYIDTETGSNPLIPFFKEKGIELFVDRTRALKTVMDDIRAAEKTYDVLIIDSVTHLWKQLQDEYIKDNHRTRLMLYDWGPLKKPWEDFVTLFLGARVHIIACGRAGYVYEERETEDGKKEQVVVDTKMRAEGEFEYETALTLEMTLVDISRTNKKPTKPGRVLVNRATVLKDRTDQLNGVTLDFPKFADFLPWFERLNIGGEHAAISSDEKSGFFEDQSEEAAFRAERRRAVHLEEIAENLKVIFPSKTDADSRGRMDIIEAATGHRSWAFLEKQASREMVAAVWEKVRRFRFLVEAEQKKPDGVLDYKFLWSVVQNEYVDNLADDVPDVKETKEKPALAMAGAGPKNGKTPTSKG